MQTSSIDELASRWPYDIIDLTTVSNFTLLEIFNFYPKRNTYWDHLIVHPHDSRLIQAFAVANDFTYIDKLKKLSGMSDRFTPAWIGSKGAYTTPILCHVTYGQLHGYDVQFSIAYASANFRVDKTRQRRAVTPPELLMPPRGVIRIKLPKVFPHILLDSNKNDKSIQSSTRASYRPNQKIDLEGDFSTYYDLFAPKGLHLDVYTLLAPNFMQQLIGASTVFDIEFFGDELIFVTNDPLYTPQAMATVTQLLDEQLTYLNRLMPSWRYTPKSAPFDMLKRQIIRSPVIKIGRHRLQPHMQVLLMLLCLVPLIVATLLAIAR